MSYLSKKGFIKLTMEVADELMEELPAELRERALEISIQVREKPSWKELLEMRAGKLFAYILPGLKLIRLFRLPILETTRPEKIRETLKGILEHELAHFFGLNDEQAWKAASREE